MMDMVCSSLEVVFVGSTASKRSHSMSRSTIALVELAAKTGVNGACGKG